jgi:hypothetical protein
MPHGHGRHAESPDAQGLAVSKATRDIGQESNWLLDARIGVRSGPLPLRRLTFLNNALDM